MVEYWVPIMVWRAFVGVASLTRYAAYYQYLSVTDVRDEVWSFRWKFTLSGWSCFELRGDPWRRLLEGTKKNISMTPNCTANSCPNSSNVVPPRTQTLLLPYPSDVPTGVPEIKYIR